jgi:hypothetical protein
MCISSNEVSSVVLDRKSWKSEKEIAKTVKDPKNQILCHEIEPNPSNSIPVISWSNVV